MKKRGLMGLLAVGLLMGLLLPASVPVLADEPVEVPAYAEEYDLLAGQDIDVGVVKVWNDEGNLYVKYVIDVEGWVMTETHLEVVCGPDGDDFPVTKNGNPKVGHFTYGESLDPPATEWSETIALGDLYCDDPEDNTLSIAAHAVVVRPLDDCSEEVWMIGEVDEGTNYYDEFNFGDAPGTGDWANRFNTGLYPYGDPYQAESGQTDFTMFPWNSNFRVPYATDFDVEWTGGLLFGGTLTLSWSPGTSNVDEQKRILTDGGDDSTFSKVNPTSFLAGTWLGYPLVEQSTALNPVADGDHWITFLHLEGDGTFWDWVKLEKPCEQWESAWADGTRFVTKGNWATYFEYELQSVLVETVEVPPTGVAVSSLSALVRGEDYELVASGTYRFANWGENGIADAKYSLRPNGAWLDGNDILFPKTYGLQVVWASPSTPPLQPVGWEWPGLGVNMEHWYTASVVGGGNAVSFMIWDDAYGDNSGFLTVEIWWTP